MTEIDGYRAIGLANRHIEHSSIIEQAFDSVKLATTAGTNLGMLATKLRRHASMGRWEVVDD